MGDYLKQQYKERDLAKRLVKIHGIIDEETQKLSDNVKNLKLSHNRMRRILKLVKLYLERLAPDDESERYLHKIITLELYGLENYKPIIKAPIFPKMDGHYELLEYIEQKGGKKCG